MSAQRYSDDVLADFSRVAQVLFLVARMAPDEIVAWLDQPCPAFGGETPARMIEDGKTDRIDRMFAMVAAGVVS